MPPHAAYLLHICTYITRVDGGRLWKQKEKNPSRAAVSGLKCIGNKCTRESKAEKTGRESEFFMIKERGLAEKKLLGVVNVPAS